MKITVRLSAGTYTARTTGQRTTASSAESAEKAAQYLAKKLDIDLGRVRPEVSADGVFTFDVLESGHYERSPKFEYAGLQSEVITVLEVWEAIGHDIGMNPNKGELLGSLRHMLERCEAHDAAQAKLEKLEPVAWGDFENMELCRHKPAEGSWVPVYATPVAQAGQVPEGWRVMRCTSSVPREGDQWEIYDPQGSGGVVSVHDVKDWTVRGLLDALAASQAQGGE